MKFLTSFLKNNPLLKNLFVQWIQKVKSIHFSHVFLPKIQKIFSKNFKWIIILLISAVLADLSLLFIGPLLLPDSNISKPAQIKTYRSHFKTTSDTQFILSSNIFHRGPIPETLNSKQNSDLSIEGPSTPTSLPLTLLGTIESSNPQLSMASILNKSQQESNSYFVGDTIDGKAQITSIQRRKVVFRNLINNRMEHIEIPLDKDILSISTLKKPLLQKTTQPQSFAPYKGISKEGNSHYSLDRSTINKHLKKLPDILQQARVKPKYAADGQILGHTFTWIKKGSVFEGLGFQEGDTLISFNGEKVSDQTEAAELFQKLRTTSNFQVKVENKDGKVQSLSYDINENASVQ